MAEAGRKHRREGPGAHARTALPTAFSLEGKAAPGELRHPNSLEWAGLITSLHLFLSHQNWLPGRADGETFFPPLTLNKDHL